MTQNSTSSLSSADDPLDPLFLRTLRGEAVETTPIWIMRQAGRYLPEYRRVREQHDFLTVCKTPDLAIEVTLQPIRRFDFDASILFSDILIPVEAMGVELAFTPGPNIAYPLSTEADIRRLTRPDPVKDLGFVLATIQGLRAQLPRHVALIGFAGAPFTLAAYLVEGGKSTNFHKLKSLMFQETVAFHALMEKLSLVVGDYLKAQIEAGAQVVQLFDTWSGLLSPSDYREYVLPHVRRIVERTHTPGVPFILYGNGTGGLLELMAATGADVLGIDWRTSLLDVRARLGSSCPIQGNLDPALLFAPPDVLQDQVRRVLEEGGVHTPHVFNLGHGITPDASPEAVAHLVRCVHEQGRLLRREHAPMSTSDPDAS